ncbi:MAG: hypothetical protein ACYTEQ_20705 [Planctomycetota bacterium]|jgi:hypothetical protein
MRPKQEMEKFIKTRQLHIVTPSEMDKRILDDSFGAMEAAKAELTGGRPNLWLILLASRVTRLAVAAVIFVVFGIVVHQLSREHTDRQPLSQAAKSPAEMLTFASLTIAYRQGGLEELEKQCEKAFELLGPRPASLSPQQVLAEFNGS